MSSEVVVLQACKDWRVSRVGVAFAHQRDEQGKISFAPAFSAWREFGEGIVQLGDASLFWVGDWINFGREAYGEKYKLALELFPQYQYQSLVNIAFVCARVPVERRRIELTFSHHREVGSLEPVQQNEWLARAVEKSWNVPEMRREMRRGAPLALDRDEKASTFNVVRWAREGARWFAKESDISSPETWSEERREALRQDLEPLVRAYVALGGKI